MSRVCAVLPAFNEAAAITAVVSGVRPHVDEVLVVDDGSGDGTGETACRAGATVISRPANGGKGMALREGIAWALARDYTHVLLMDADGQHSVADVPTLVAAASDEGVDLAIGERLFRKAEMPPSRYYSNVIGSWALSKFIGVPVADTQSGFRLVRCDVLRGLDLTARGYEIETEMLIRLARRGARIRRVPVRALSGTGRSNLRPIRDTTRTCFLAVKYRFILREHQE